MSAQQNVKAHDLQQKIRGFVETLANETDAARQSGLFTQFLKTSAQFHRYSWGNQMLIFSQRPSASRVAGFQTWKQMGRWVRAGEKGIAIFAPMIFRKQQRNSTDETDSNAEQTAVRFRIVHVFDIAQTDGASLPELPTACGGEGKGLTERLLSFARAHGITVETRKLDGQTKGYAHEQGKAIVLGTGLSSGDRAAVLIHEITHCLLHFGESKPNQKQLELEAEAASFVVASHFELNPESKFYLASYGVKASDLLESMPVIQATAAQIIGACEESAEADAEAEPLAA